MLRSLILFRWRKTTCGTAAANGPFVQPPHGTWINTEQRCKDTDGGKTEGLREKPVLAPLHVPQTSHGLIWHRPQASAATIRLSYCVILCTSQHQVLKVHRHRHQHEAVPTQEAYKRGSAFLITYTLDLYFTNCILAFTPELCININYIRKTIIFLRVRYLFKLSNIIKQIFSLRHFLPSDHFSATVCV
jgi:hypothetical protein